MLRRVKIFKLTINAGSRRHVPNSAVDTAPAHLPPGNRIILTRINGDKQKANFSSLLKLLYPLYQRYRVPNFSIVKLNIILQIQWYN